MDPATQQRHVEAALSNPLHEVALTSFILGSILGVCVPFAFSSENFQLPLYVILVMAFHFLEYFITSLYQYDKVNVDSFVIRNGFTYIIAHSIALFETLVEMYVSPNWKSQYTILKFLGLFIAVSGQSLRSLAMIHAGESFSHLISVEKQSNHRLIKTGVYSLVRHPSYVGFFYWAIGTQILLVNPVSLVIFIYLLYRFFLSRIQFEEIKLIEFFGKDYVQYKKEVRSGLPFV